MDPLLDFSGKVAIITGVASGFGKQLSTSLHQRGAKLVVGDIDEAGMAELVESLGDNIVGQRCDVSSEADCAALVKTAQEKFGRLDIAVNNAGVGDAMSLTHETTEQVFDKQMAVNLKSVLMGMKYQIPAMIEGGGGAVLNVSSMAGLGGAPNMSAYAAAKHGVIGLSKTAAVEYARKNVRVNAICPFFSPTNIGAGFLKAEGSEEVLSRGCPMKRYGTIEEVVNAMLLILSPGNSYMTGQAIAVDGAVSAI